MMSARATAIWDGARRYATTMREVLPAEQHVHSVLEMLPLIGLLMVIALHWDQFFSGWHPRVLN